MDNKIKFMEKPTLNLMTTENQRDRMKLIDNTLGQYNLDKNGNIQAIHIIRQQVVSKENFSVVLGQIPDSQIGVAVISPDNFYEVPNYDDLTEESYYRKGRRLYFHPSMAGKTVKVDYYGIGIELISASSVYTQIDDYGNIVQTLGDMFEVGKTIVDALNTMGDTITIIHNLETTNIESNNLLRQISNAITELKATIKLAETTNDILNETINIGNSRNTEWNKTINTGDNMNSTLIQTTKDANNKNTQLNATITNAENKKDEVNIAINNANTIKDNLIKVDQAANATKGSIELSTRKGQEVLDGLHNSEIANLIKENNIDKSIASVKGNNILVAGLSTTLFPHYNPSSDARLLEVYKRQTIDCSLCVMVNIDTTTSSNLTNQGMPYINSCIEKIQSENIKINMLKPHLGVNYRDDTYRGNIKPINIPLFFENWKNILLVYAKLCSDKNINTLSINVEMDYLTQNEYSNYWKDIYDTIKHLYPNLILVAVLSTNEWNNIQNHEKSIIYSDIVGLNVYLSFTNKSVNDATLGIEDITMGFENNQWGANLIKAISYINDDLNKYVMISETGVTATEYGLTKIEQIDKTVYRRGQLLFFKGFLQTIAQIKTVIGFNIWHTDEPWSYFDKGSINEVEQYITNFIKRRNINDFN